MNERDEGLLKWIREETEFVLEQIEPLVLQDFINNKHVQHSVCMALINIGESVKALSKDLKNEYQNIQWQDITDLRNVAVHNYGGLRMEWIWKNATKDVPELLEQVRGILHAEGVEE